MKSQQFFIIKTGTREDDPVNVPFANETQISTRFTLRRDRLDEYVIILAAAAWVRPFNTWGRN